MWFYVRLYKTKYFFCWRPRHSIFMKPTQKKLFVSQKMCLGGNSPSVRQKFMSAPPIIECNKMVPNILVVAHNSTLGALDIRPHAGDSVSDVVWGSTFADVDFGGSKILSGIFSSSAVIYTKMRFWRFAVLWFYFVSLLTPAPKLHFSSITPSALAGHCRTI